MITAKEARTITETAIFEQYLDAIDKAVVDAANKGEHEIVISLSGRLTFAQLATIMANGFSVYSCKTNKYKITW